MQGGSSINSMVGRFMPFIISFEQSVRVRAWSLLHSNSGRDLISNEIIERTLQHKICLIFN